ncbi:hemagglutinin repeat-containing protein, partial [uncultured Veillonella sp.]|uniref:hemagglutinin repeat-containing protein n=1 Tax=uncultured Veillonella sp. TaxID=159268 RepID=UPI0025890813
MSVATVEAGTHIHLTSSDVIGAKGIHIEGNSVTLDGKNNITRERYEHEASSSGLSISLGGSVASAATTAVNYLQQANHRSDKRLAALETLEAGKSLKEGLNAVDAFSHFSVSDVQNAYDTAAASAARDAELARATKQPKDVIAAKELQADELHRIAKDPKAVQDRYNQEKAAKRDSLVNIHVGIGSSHSKSVTEVNETTYAGGTMQSADGTVRIIARGNSDTTSTTKGDITAIGQTIQGKVVDLQAKGDVNLLAGTNTTHITEDSKSSGWSVGASIGTTGFLGGDIGINKAKSEGLTDRTTHTGTTVVGTEAVTITSEKDTNIVGSTVSGNKVVAQVGNDLTITSVQDTDNYKSTSKTSGMSISYTPGHAGIVSGGTTKGDIHSQYRSVTSQAGIYAGTDGYDITVKDNTTLTGSVIDSTATPDKNSLTTGSLTMKDIENKASYEDAYSGIGFTYDKTFKDIEKTVTDRGYATAEEKEYLDKNYNKVGLVPDLGISSNDSTSSMTKSAVAPGKLTVTKKPVNIDEINRDTKNSLKELGKIFDKKKLEERQELAKLFAKNADEAIHKISDSKGWKDGSKEKIALHTLVGGITAELGGHSFVDGSLAGGVNEAVVGKLMDAIGKDKPDMVQIASAVLGYATNKLAGKDG